MRRNTLGFILVGALLGAAEAAAGTGATTEERAVLRAFGDADGDGLVDLYVVAPREEDRLYRNRGDGTFEDVTAAFGLAGRSGTRSATWVDFDGDGRLDLSLTTFAGGLALFRGEGDAGFRELSAAVGLDAPGFVREAEWMDYDRDGRLDLAVDADGSGPLFFHAREGGTFERVELAPPVAGAPSEVTVLPPARGEAEVERAPLAGRESARPEPLDTSPELAPLSAGAPPAGPPSALGLSADDVDAWIPPAPKQGTACILEPASQQCVEVSILPRFGALYPLGNEFSIDETGRVAIGFDGPPPASLGTGPANRRLHVRIAETNAVAVFGESTSTGGANEGVRGESSSPAGRGVSGEAPSEGVRGVATASAGAARGVCGTSASTDGEGVLGEASAGSGDNVGVRGTSASAQGRGVEGRAPAEGLRGVATAGSGAARGVCGTSDSTEGEGVLGEATAESGATVGIRGRNASMDGSGVEGVGPGVGVRGIASRPTWAGDSIGVYGTSDTGAGIGVAGAGFLGLMGKTEQHLGTAVLGDAYSSTANAVGVHGRSLSNYRMAAGVLAEGNGAAAPGLPLAAALEIRNGAIVVSGAARPAGTMTLDSPIWTSVKSCGPSPHTIGYYTDAVLENDLIVEDSVILLTVYAQTAAEDSAYYAEIWDSDIGEASIRVAVVGITGGGCMPPPPSFEPKLNYLIVNPIEP